AGEGSAHHRDLQLSPLGIEGGELDFFLHLVSGEQGEGSRHLLQGGAAMHSRCPVPPGGAPHGEAVGRRAGQLPDGEDDPPQAKAISGPWPHTIETRRKAWIAITCRRSLPTPWT